MKHTPEKRPEAGALLDSVKDLANRDADAFVMLYFQVTALVVELDRAGYEYLAAGVMVKTFRESGFIQALAQLKQKLDGGDVQGALERLEAIKGWVQTIKDLASQERFETLLAEHTQAAKAETKAEVGYVM
jgi:hypothetical protein